MTQDQLENAQQSLRYWRAQADAFDDRLVQLRLVARQLDDALAPLHRVFDPMRHLHTTSTWEGNAATNSRRRLDAHEDRCAMAIRSIHNLIADLEDTGRVVQRQADVAQRKTRDYRVVAERLEFELLKAAT